MKMRIMMKQMKKKTMTTTKKKIRKKIFKKIMKTTNKKRSTYYWLTDFFVFLMPSFALYLPYIQRVMDTPHSLVFGTYNDIDQRKYVDDVYYCTLLPGIFLFMFLLFVSWN